jgi:nucleolar protein 56
MVEDSHQLARILIEFEDRSQITEASLLKLGIPESVAHSIVESTLEGIGGDLSKKDLEAIRTLAGSIEQLYAVRQNLEQYVGIMMISVAPNTTTLVGPIIGARLMSLAGSLRDLARRPSSTIQVLGAEKALFRSLKTGTDPPKHGIIFQTPEIYSAPYWQRGKIARALAGKLAIAARIDAFSKRDVGQTLRVSLDRRIEEIRQQNPQPPVPTAKPATRPPARRMPRSRPPRDVPRKKRGGRHS